MTEPRTASPAADGAAGAAAASEAPEATATATVEATDGAAEGAATADGDRSAEQPGPTGRAVLLGVGVLWMLALLWSARASSAAFADRDSAVIFTASNLFGPVTAAFAIGGSAALGALAGLDRRFGPRSALPRFGFAAAAGLLAGLGCALLAWALLPDGRIVPDVAVALGVASVLGGALAGFRPGRVYAAGLVGTYVTFGVRVVLGMFTGRLSRVFGASNSIASMADAQGKVALFTSVVAGIVTGYAAYRYLRRSPHPTRWPGYLVAGAVSGALALLAEVVSQIVGTALVDSVAGAASAADHVVLSLQSTAVIDGAMIVLFAGAVTAVVAVGRTLNRKPAGPAR